MRSTKPLSISKKKKEWGIIDRVVNNSIEKKVKNKLSFYLRSEIIKLKRCFDECEECLSRGRGEPIRRRPLITRVEYDMLIEMSKKLNMEPSEIIERFIIDPMLLQEIGM